MDVRKIGVFDSGIGGLTVLSDLVNRFPNEDFLYLADTKNCPYGTKSKEEIVEIVRKNIDYLIKENVKMIVIACNTATVNSYSILKNIPIVRIIDPTAKKINEIEGRVLLLATNYTISSGIYQSRIARPIEVEPCSDFVGLVEEGKTQTPESLEVVRRHLEKFKGRVDTVCLACTHFGLLVPEIKEVLGDVQIIDSSNMVGDVVQEELAKNLRKNSNEVGRIDLITTGEVSMLKIDWFDKRISSFQKVEI